MNGKGSNPRPLSAPYADYAARHDAIFGKRKLLPKRRVVKKGKG